MNKWLFKGSTPKQPTIAKATTARDSREAGLKVAGLIQTRKGEPFSRASKDMLCREPLIFRRPKIIARNWSGPIIL